MMKSRQFIQFTAVLCIGLALMFGFASAVRANEPQSFSKAEVISISSTETQSNDLAEVSCGQSKKGNSVGLVLGIVVLILGVGLLASTMSEAN